LPNTGAGIERTYAHAAGHFSPLSRTLISLAVILFAAGMAAVPYAITAPSGADDVNWAKRSLAPWWFGSPRLSNQAWTPDYFKAYYQCIDHPSVARIVYRKALGIMGVRSLPMEEWDYAADALENVAKGRVLPYEVRIGLRMVNFAFFAAALCMAFFGLKKILGNRLLAVLGALALALEPSATRTLNGVVPYIGADAIFYFWVMATWLTWLEARREGLAGAALVGLVAGVATSTKINGAFLVVGAAAYFAAYSTGLRRVWYALAAGLCAVGAFLALNPIYFGGGWAWGAQVFRDTIAARFYVRETQVATEWGKYTRVEVILATLPHVYFLVPAAGIMALSRRERWFGATAFWSGSIIAGNLALMYMFMPRHAAPVRAAFLTAFAAGGLTVVGDVWRSARSRLR